MKGLVRACADEYRAIFTDGGAVLVLVGALVLYAFFYPIPYLRSVLKDVPVVVVDLDSSSTSRLLVRMTDAHELLRVAGSAGSLAEAERKVHEGLAGGVIVVPAGFERAVRRGEQARVALHVDAGYFLIYRQVLTGASEVTGTLSAGIEIKRLQAQGLTEVAAKKARDPIALLSRPLFNATEGYSGYVVPAVLVLILQQTLLVGIGLVRGTSRDRRAGTRRPDRPAASALATVAGRALAYASLYLFHALVYFGVVFRLLGFPQRAGAGLLLTFAVPFLLAVALLGLTLGAAFRTRETSIQVLLCTSLPAVFLAGFAWPVESLPPWLRALSLLLPSTSAIPGFLRLTEMGAALPDVGAEWLLLWKLAAVYLAAAWLAERLGRRRSDALDAQVEVEIAG